jgi:hypothetical protein
MDRISLSRRAFIDETVRDPKPDTRGYYQLTAALIDGPAVSSLRTSTRAAAPPGGFHASALAQTQVADVDRMLQHIADTPDCWNLIAATYKYEVKGQQETARRSCLERLLLDIDRSKISHVVVDSREANIGKDPEARNRNDQRTLARLRSAGHVSRHMTLEHKHDEHEPLLWLPDAAGWAFRQNELRGNPRFWDLVSDATTVYRL